MLFAMSCFLCLALIGADTHVLLVGVADYGEPQYNLKSAENDVALMESFIRERIPDAKIKRLINREATHTKVVQALAALQTAAAEDQIIFFFSGHGSTTKDLNGDEQGTGGHDQTLVTYGARRGNSSSLDDFDILDDEINHYLSQLKTKRILAIIDACHAGSATRAGGVRNLDPDERTHPMGTFSYQQTYPGVRLGASASDQIAYSYEVNNRPYGLFTWNLIQVLREARADDSWRDLIRKTFFQMKDQFDQHQVPQLEGSGFPVGLLTLGSQGMARQNQNEVTGLVSNIQTEKEQISLEFRLFLGVEPGSLFRSEDGQSVFEVTRTAGTMVHARRVKGRMPVLGDRLVLSEFVRNPQSRIRLAMATDLDSVIWLERLREVIESGYGRLIEVVPLTAYPEWTLHVRRLAGRKGWYESLPPSDDEGGLVLWVTNQTGELHVHQPLLDLADQNYFEPLERALRACIRRWDLLAMVAGSDPNPAFKFEVIPCRKGVPKIKGGLELRYHPSSSRVFHEVALPRDGHLLKNTVLAYRIHNLEPIPYYFYVLNIGPDGAIYPCFPPSQAEENAARIGAGESITSRYEQAVFMKQAGKERLIVLRTPTPIDVELLRLESKVRLAKRKLPMPAEWQALSRTFRVE